MLLSGCQVLRISVLFYVAFGFSGVPIFRV